MLILCCFCITPFDAARVEYGHPVTVDGVEEGCGEEGVVSYPLVVLEAVPGLEHDAFKAQIPDRPVQGRARPALPRYDPDGADFAVHGHHEIEPRPALRVLVEVQLASLCHQGLGYRVLSDGTVVHADVAHHDLADQLRFVQIHQDPRVKHVQLEHVAAGAFLQGHMHLRHPAAGQGNIGHG